jgi:hypothetical protein
VCVCEVERVFLCVYLSVCVGQSERARERKREIEREEGREREREEGQGDNAFVFVCVRGVGRVFLCACVLVFIGKR